MNTLPSFKDIEEDKDVLQKALPSIYGIQNHVDVLEERRLAVIEPSAEDKIAFLTEQMENKVALKQKEERVERATKLFASLFQCFSENYCHIEFDELKALNSKELIALERIVARKLTPRWYAALFSSFTVVGSIVWLADGYRSLEYFSSRRKLKKLCGDDWFPCEVIKEKAYFYWDWR